MTMTANPREAIVESPTASVPRRTSTPIAGLHTSAVVLDLIVESRLMSRALMRVSGSMFLHPQYDTVAMMMNVST